MAEHDICPYFEKRCHFIMDIARSPGGASGYFNKYCAGEFEGAQCYEFMKKREQMPIEHMYTGLAGHTIPEKKD